MSKYNLISIQSNLTILNKRSTTAPIKFHIDDKNLILMRNINSFDVILFG